MIRIAVLDDEEMDIKTVEKVTEESMENLGYPYRIVSYVSAEQLLIDIEEDNKYDIYLLDIELPETSGIRVAADIRKKYYDPIIIYITNYVEYAVEGYEVNAYRYIPKNMIEQKLPKAYASICPKLVERRKDYYIIEKNNRLEKINLEDIYYVKKEDKYLAIVHKSGTSRERKGITDFLDNVKEREMFLQADRGCVVNVFHVMFFEDSQIVLRNGERIPVSRPKLQSVKKELLRIWRGSMG